MGAQLLLNSGANILAFIYNFACEITKLSLQHSVCLGANMTPKLYNPLVKFGGTQYELQTSPRASITRLMHCLKY